MEIEHIDFYGLKITSLTKADFRGFVVTTIKADKKAIIYGYSIGSIVLAKKFPEILWANEADISLIDGQGLYYLIKLLKFNVNNCFSIPNSVNEILTIANKNCFSILLYGSDKDTNKKASRNVLNKYPNIKVLNGLDGYSRTIEESIEVINKYKPNVLLIGISSPIKEVIAFKNKESISSNIIIPCGGMIDVLAGKTRQSGDLLKKLGLASVVRLVQEPRRLFKRYLYLYYNILLSFLPKLFYAVYLKRGSFTIQKLLKIVEK